MKARLASFGDVLELRVTLRKIEPAIWRLVRVPADLTLGQLHGGAATDRDRRVWSDL